jgi:pimeloyl-ACP methyl ester carboxylesterase
VSTTAADGYRSGSGEPLVLLHGILADWHVWLPVLPALTTRHDVYALTLPGHRGGPDLQPGIPISIALIADGVEAMLDSAGIDKAHIAGNSLGGWLAIELGRRGRARSVVALSPAGGWGSAKDLRRVIRLLKSSRAVLGCSHGRALSYLFSRSWFRRLALRSAMEHGDRIPVAEALGMLEAVLSCTAFAGFIDWVQHAPPIGEVSAPQDYPIRLAWGDRDKTIPFEAYGRPLVSAIPEAEMITLPGVGHVPMYDDPELVANSILAVTDTNNPN